MRTPEVSVGYRLERCAANAPAAARLIRHYLDELGARLGGFDPGRSVSADPHEMAPPGGAFFVLYGEGPIACGGVKRFGAGVGEIKRMFVEPWARGRGHGRRVLAALEDEARALGFERVVLDTAAPLDEARALYVRAGYREIAAYNENPYAAHWFEKRLPVR